MARRDEQGPVLEDLYEGQDGVAALPGDRADQPGQTMRNTNDPSQTSEGQYPSDPGPVPGPLPEGFACRPGALSQVQRLE